MASKFARARKVLGRLSMAERLLLALSYDPGLLGEAVPPGRSAGRWTLQNALKTLRRSFPDFDDIVRGRRVLDYGCGDGFQAVALARESASFVLGVEIESQHLAHARMLAMQTGQTNVHFRSEIEGVFDVAISLNAMEHFIAPQANLRDMSSAVMKEGWILVSFGPPWYAPFGAHMYFFCPVPWINAIFSEHTVMRIRSLYRNDNLMTYAPELNKMSIAKFERLIAQSGLRIERCFYRCFKGLNFLGKIPVLRELFITQVDVVLRK